jgi:hypothetical protein
VAEAVVASHDWTYAIVTEAAAAGHRVSRITGGWWPSMPPGPGAGVSGISVT